MAAAGCVIGSASLLLSVALFARIDASRAQVTYQACVEQNLRGAATIRKYDQQIEILTKAGLLTGERLERAKESRRFTVALISTLAPRQDCSALDDLK